MLLIILLSTIILLFNLTNSFLLRFNIEDQGHFFEFKKITCDNQLVQNPDLHAYFPIGFQRTCPSLSESRCGLGQHMRLQLHYRIHNAHPVQYIVSRDT